ncbi:hypothetical protein GCM10025869_32310 [Homoserinibacter gongjuensis]|uniref:Uncharacterized protein n=1 Tax=Homoserinibacter gongjuensis TaxID=1162968 RepID=A0ABQ6K1B1_9MICO|nr:hypothetical protein GCM10025869_32310 [Homoserinibacter gongjuensis]
MGEERAEHPLGSLRVAVDASLEPQLVDGVGIVPSGEEAHAVAERGELVEGVEHSDERQLAVDGLCDGEGRLDVELEPCHEAERPERDHGPREVGFAAPQRDELARAVDELDAAHRGRERPVANARAVRAGGDGARDRDVGEGCEVREREIARLERAREFAVAEAGRGGDARAVVGDADVAGVGESGRRQEHACGVGDGREGMPRAERAQGTGSGIRHERLHLVDGARRDHPVGAEREVTGPVAHAIHRLDAIPARAGQTLIWRAWTPSCPYQSRTTWRCASVQV